MKKNITILPLLALLLLCGCNQKHESELKTRVDKLEAQQKLTTQSLDELLALTKSHQDQNQKMFNDLQRVALSQSTNMDNVGKLFLEHLSNSALHSWPKPVAARGRTPVENQPIPAAQIRDSVPLEVFYTIAEQAIKKWPRDYQKQENYILAETERYKKLHP